MSPEQRRDPRVVSPASDLFALAMTFAWVLLGEVPEDPWTDEGQAQLTAAGVPIGLVAAIAHCGARRPEDRPPSAEAAAEAFRRCGVVAAPLTDRLHALASGPPEIPPESAVSALAAPPPSRARGRWMVAAPAALAISAVAGLWRWTDSASELPARAAAVGAAPLPACDGLDQWAHLDRYPRSSADAAGLREAGPPVVADFDADGHPDVAFPHQLDATLRIFWGTGDARLGPAFTDIETDRTSRLSAPAAGDVDGDGDLDLAVYNYENSSYAIVWNQGKRTFDRSEPVFHGERIERIQLADWDSDGRLDLLMNGPWSHPKSASDGTVVTGTAFFTEQFGSLLGRATILAAAPTRPSTIWAFDEDKVQLIALESGRPQRQSTTTQALPVRIEGTDAMGTPGIGVRHTIGGIQAIQILPDGSTCALPEVPSRELMTVGDVNGDGRLDAVWSSTCAYCTSAYWAAFG